MKTTHRYILGAIVGIAAAFLVPPSNSAHLIIEDIANVVLRMGRYLFLPLIFFSLPIAVTKLRRRKRLGRLLSRSSLYALIASALLALTGTIIALTFKIGRIPVVSVPIPLVEITPVGEIIQNIVSLEKIGSPAQEGGTLLALIILAFLLGWHFFHDKEIAEPSYNFFDSFSRILYRANRYILMLMPLFLAVLAFHTTYISRSTINFRSFIPLLLVLLGVCIVLIGAVYPLLLWLLGYYKSPWRILGHLSGAFIGAFISASPMFNYGNITFHLKEKLKIPRLTAALAAPTYLLLARGGTALVSGICMITVIRSYSSLEITLFQAAWIALFSFLVSFALPMVPDRGLSIALAILGNLYGRGLENGWLILTPIIPLLMMICTLLDTATGAVLLVLAHKHSGLDVSEEWQTP